MAVNSSLKSNLSSPKYGYDLVVGTTQQSINAEMNYLLYKMAKAGHSSTHVWITDPESELEEPPIIPQDWKTFLASAECDPFDESIFPDQTIIKTNGKYPTNDKTHLLAQSGFQYAFRYKLGLPKGVALKDLPPTILLNDNSSAVTYNMLCSEFTIVVARWAGSVTPIRKLFRYSQKPGVPWYFRSEVNLHLAEVIEDATTPAAVKKAINNLSDTAYSLQQLLLDLNTARLTHTAPVLASVAKDANDKYTTDALKEAARIFSDVYWEQLKVAGAGDTGFGYTVTQPKATGSLVPTKLDIIVSLPVAEDGSAISPISLSPAQRQLSTLNYVCATGGNGLPRTTGFDWNWVSPAENSQFHGCLGINRDTFAHWFATTPTLLEEAHKCCVNPKVRLPWKTFAPNIVATVELEANPPSFTIVHDNNDRSHVLNLHHHSTSKDKAGPSDDYITELNYDFDVDVYFKDNIISIVQHVVFRLDAKCMNNHGNGNLVDCTMREDHTIAVDGDGARLTSKRTDYPMDDRSEHPDFGWIVKFFTDLDVYVKIFGQLGRSAASEMQHIPDTDIQAFVFPGGRTFAFKDVTFSQNQDLVAHITYVDPTLNDFENL